MRCARSRAGRAIADDHEARRRAACACWRIASIAHSSGPMPAGSPAVIASVGASPAWGRYSGSTGTSAASPQSSAFTPCATRTVRRRRRRRSMRACAKPASARRRLAEHPQELERVARRRSRPCAARRGRAAARSPRARTPGTGRASRDSARPAVPATRWRVLRSNQPPGGSAISTSPPSRSTGATSSASPHMNCVSKSRTSALPGNASGIARITGMPVAAAVAITGFEIGNEPIAEREPLAADRLDLGSERPRLALADAVQAQVRREHRRLQPAHVQLRRRLRGP